jgi:hypothetical protein
MARRRGWPREKAWFSLGRWGMLVNSLAIIYGATMLLNIGIWQDKGLFGEFGGDGRGFTNPGIGSFLTPFGNKIEGLPAWPTFETLIGVILVTGAIYYAVAIRGRAHDIEADTATGEAVIA